MILTGNNATQTGPFLDQPVSTGPVVSQVTGTLTAGANATVTR